MSIIARAAGSSVIGQQQEDGYVNLTAMAKASGKKINDYLRLKSVKAFLEELSTETGIIPASALIEIRKGGDYKLEQGTWGHPLFAIECARWCSPEEPRSFLLIFFLFAF